MGRQGLGQWEDHGTPAGHTLDPPVIGTASYENNPMAFTYGHNGHLWVNWWDGKAWKWQDQRAPHGQTVQPGQQFNPPSIVTASRQGNPYVFAVGSDGHLWANWWDGKAWHWTDHGTPPGPDPLDAGEIATASWQDKPMVFTRTQDGQQTGVQLWANHWDGSAWHWAEQDTPPGTKFPLYTIAAISCQSTPYVFVWDDDSGSASDPHLWVNWQS